MKVTNTVPQPDGRLKFRVEFTEFGNNGQTSSGIILPGMSAAMMTPSAWGFIGNYKGLTAPMNAREITDEMVDQEIRMTLAENKVMNDVERPAAEGDVVIIDYKGMIDGVAFEGGTATEQSLQLGSHMFIPGFEEQVVGMSAGEERDIPVKFPEQYHAEVAGKDAVFHILVHKVCELIDPEIDDQFAQEFYYVDSADKINDGARAKLEQAAKEEAETAYRTMILGKALDLIEIEIPSDIIDKQVQQIVANLEETVTQRGLSMEQFFQVTGGSYEQLQADAKGEAVNHLKSDVLMAVVASNENVSVSDEEINAQYKQMAQMYGISEVQIAQYIPRQQLRDDMLRAKAFSVLLSLAQVEEAK